MAGDDGITLQLALVSQPDDISHGSGVARVLQGATDREYGGCSRPPSLTSFAESSATGSDSASAQISKVRRLSLTDPFREFAFPERAIRIHSLPPEHLVDLSRTLCKRSRVVASSSANTSNSGFESAARGRQSGFTRVARRRRTSLQRGQAEKGEVGCTRGPCSPPPFGFRQHAVRIDLRLEACSRSGPSRREARPRIVSRPGSKAA